MSNPALLVREFHEAYGLTMRFQPQLAPPDERAMRIDILAEEFREYLAAESNDDLVEIADAIADMVYVLYGTALTYGIPLSRTLMEVHSSNMSKLDENGDPIYRPDGKVLKGPNYRPPNIEEVLWPTIKGSTTARITGE